jgi:hypothetical protein
LVLQIAGLPLKLLNPSHCLRKVWNTQTLDEAQRRHHHANSTQLNSKPKLVLAGLALTLLSITTFSAQASLVDRGNGMLYDNVLNLTWLQDANYANTSGYASATGGAMDWTTATTWATNLVYGGYSDWRLASNTPVNGNSFNYNISNNGTTDVGYNITSPNSELAYMYNVNLGLKDYFSPTGAFQPDYGIFGNGTYNGVDTWSYGQNNVGLVNNLQSYFYWSGAESSPGTAGFAWVFYTGHGEQNPLGDKAVQYYAWAVRPGDVAAVPVPGALWLFGSGLVGLLGFKRRGNIG